jgi:hypothetical protein
MVLAGLSYVVQIEWSGASFGINVNFKGTSVKCCEKYFIKCSGQAVF